MLATIVVHNSNSNQVVNINLGDLIDILEAATDHHIHMMATNSGIARKEMNKMRAKEVLDLITDLIGKDSSIVKSSKYQNIEKE